MNMMNVNRDVHLLLLNIDDSATKAGHEFGLPVYTKDWMEATAAKIEALIQERVEERLLEEARHHDYRD